MPQDLALPFSQEPIFVDWRRPDVGGLRVTAWTDNSGNPYIGVFTLNREDKPNGLPCWLERRRFLSYVVIGFADDSAPIKVFLDAEVTHRGLQASLQLPWLPAHDYFYHRRLVAHWGSEAPSMGFHTYPSQDEEVARYTLSEAI